MPTAFYPQSLTPPPTTSTPFFRGCSSRQHIQSPFGLSTSIRIAGPQSLPELRSPRQSRPITDIPLHCPPSCPESSCPVSRARSSAPGRRDVQQFNRLPTQPFSALFLCFDIRCSGTAQTPHRSQILFHQWQDHVPGDRLCRRKWVVDQIKFLDDGFDSASCNFTPDDFSPVIPDSMEEMKAEASPLKCSLHHQMT